MNIEKSEARGEAARVHASPVRRPTGMLAGIWKLLRLKVRVEMVEFTHSKTSYKVVNGFAYLFFALMTAFICVACWGMLLLIRSTGLDGSLGLRETPALLLSAALFFSLPSAFAVLLQEFFLSKDLSFLLSLPIPVRSVLATKIIAAALPGLAMYSLFYIPYLAALGQSYGFSLWFYVAMLVPPAAIFLASSSLCSLLVLVAVRFFSPRAIWIGLAVLFVLAFSAAVLLDPYDSHLLRNLLDPQKFSFFLNLALRSNLPLSPLAWAGRGLVALGENQFLWGAGLMAPLLLICALVFFSLLAVGERLYLEGYGRLAGRQPKRGSTGRGRFRAPLRIVTWISGWIPRTVRAILFKDLRFFYRDLQYLAVMLVPVFMGGMILLSLLRVHPHQAAAAAADPLKLPLQLERFLEMIILYVPPLFTYFASVLFGIHILIPLVSLEGRSFWILRTTPVSPSQFVAAKYLTGLCVLLPFYAAFTLLLQLILGRPYIALILGLYIQTSQAFALAALAAFYLYLSAAQARFDWVNPNKLVTIGTMLYSLGGALLIACVCLLFYVLPSALYAFNLHPVLAMLVGLLSGTVFCAWVIRWQLRLTAARVEKIFLAD